MKRDIENVLDDIETMLKAKYNTKLSSIDTEKGDGITLTQVNSSAYALQTLNNEIINYNPFILYGINDVNTVSSLGPASANAYKIDIVVMLADGGNDSSIARRLLRYLRALQEVTEENYASISQSDKFTIETLEPVSLKLVNSSANYRAIGVRLNFEGVL